MLTTDGFREVEWPRFLQGPDQELLERLYVPGLARAVRYDRCCAYFRSTVLAAAARGFAGLIERLLAEQSGGPVVRLLVNEQLSQEDVDALLARGDMSALERRLLRGLITPTEALVKDRLAMLSWLAARGWLEVRVAVMRQANAGILHAKYGLLTDGAGEQLAFFGSGNETASALSANFEMLTVHTGWDDPEAVEYYRASFERIWAGEDPRLCTVSLPDAVRLKLISYAPAEPPTIESHDLVTSRAALLWRYIAAAPYLPGGEETCDATALVNPWPHQRHVVEETARAYPAGRLLCDEVGMGKTVEALLVLRHLLAGRGVKRALLLVPAGLLRQWQAELREKGGLLVPYWEQGKLVQPNGEATSCEARTALGQQPLLLLSREWARLANNRELVLAAPRYDLVLMDEAHAARRRTNEEGEFNTGNLLLDLLRQLQLRGQARGILLLSATPMQTQPWEPWDLLSVLGVGGHWLAGFEEIRQYYAAVGQLAQGLQVNQQAAGPVVKLVVEDEAFPALPDGVKPEKQLLQRRLTFPRGAMEAQQTSDWLRKGAPLGRRMHRNTRETLRAYYQLGLLAAPPPTRQVEDVVFDYRDAREREAYKAITGYIDHRFEQLEGEKAGKGFVMTVYRRRLASSPYALKTSLRRRLNKLEQVIRALTPAALVWTDEDEIIGDRLELEPDLDMLLDEALPKDPDVARAEATDIRQLLARLDGLDQTDSKRDQFYTVLERALADSRRVLVFTEYADTMRYLRDWLYSVYKKRIGCYSGEGGQVSVEGEWHTVTKAEITRRLTVGELDVLICTDAASEGLNLQAASVVINYDLPWNPSRVEQRIGRVDRIGQAREQVWVRNLFLDESVDMRVYELLRRRCGLFTHFVGHMQPVLDRARRALTDLRSVARLEDVLSELEEAAQDLEDDKVVRQAFVEAEAQAMTTPQPAVCGCDLRQAMEGLVGLNGKAHAKRDERRGGWWVYGLGRARRLVALDSEVLEANPDAEPLTALSALAGELAEALPGPALSPLVVARQEQGAYCCCEVRWVSSERGIETVSSMARLVELLAAWTGLTPPPDMVLAAQKGAEEAATLRLGQMVEGASRAFRSGLQQQLAAARLRLLRELGRTLACAGDDLDQVLHGQVSREGTRPGRYGQAVRQLGGYPVWTREQVQDACGYAAALSEGQRSARLAGSELDAALADPRWLATEGLKRERE